MVATSCFFYFITVFGKRLTVQITSHMQSYQFQKYVFVHFFLSLRTDNRKSVARGFRLSLCVSLFEERKNGVEVLLCCYLLLDFFTCVSIAHLYQSS